MGFKMTFRWFGPKDDNIPLKYIRQIPGIYGVVTALLTFRLVRYGQRGRYLS